MGEYMLRVRLDSRKATLDRVCGETGLTMSEVIKVLLDAIENNRIEIRGGEVVATEEMMGLLRPDDYEGLGFAGVLRMMRKKEYPDSVIRKMNEQHMIQIGDMAKYDVRRSGDDWC